MRNGILVGFVPSIPGSENFDDAAIVDAIAAADYDQPVGRSRPSPRPAYGAPVRSARHSRSPSAYAERSAPDVRPLTGGRPLTGVRPLTDVRPLTHDRRPQTPADLGVVVGADQHEKGIRATTTPRSAGGGEGWAARGTYGDCSGRGSSRRRAPCRSSNARSGVAHHAQHHLLAPRAARHHPGARRPQPQLRHRAGPSAVRARRDRGGDVDREDLAQVAGQRVAVDRGLQPLMACITCLPNRSVRIRRGRGPAPPAGPRPSRRSRSARRRSSPARSPAASRACQRRHVDPPGGSGQPSGACAGVDVGARRGPGRRGPAGQLSRRSRRPRASRTEYTSRNGVPAAGPRRGRGSSPSAARCRSRRRPAAPARAASGRQTNQPPTGPRSSSGSPTARPRSRYGETSPSGDPLDGQLHAVGPSARRGDRVDCAGRGSRPRRSAGRRRAGRRRWPGQPGTSSTSVRGAVVSRARTGTTRARPARSVAPVPLLAPWVSVVVVAERSPRSRARRRCSSSMPLHPLGRLPQVQVRDQQPGRAAVLGVRGPRRRSRYAIHALPSSRSSSGRLVV